MTLTPNDKKVLAFIYTYRNQHGISPTLDEIKTHFEFKSLTSVQRSIASLENHKLIERNKFIRRGIEAVMQGLTVQIPLIGTVACGLPILAQENYEGYIPTDKTLLHGDKSNYFYLRAQGDSMNEAGINDGDMLLVHVQPTAEDGQKVVALIDDSATVKLLHRFKNHVMLVPKSSNPIHKPIVLRHDFRIQGLVVANMSV